MLKGAISSSHMQFLTPWNSKPKNASRELARMNKTSNMQRGSCKYGHRVAQL